MKKVRVFAPATVANVACGYNILGFAINKPGDEVIARLTDEPEVVISKIKGDKGELPKETDKNTAGVAVQAFLNEIKAEKGIELEIHKRMPSGSGLGSSAASAVAAVFAANTLFDDPLNKKQLLPFTIKAEKMACGSSHADNVAPSLLGGLVLIKSYEPLDIIRIPTPELYCTIVHPDIIIRTEDAKRILKPEISLEAMVTQTGNIAGLISGLHQGDYGLISRSLEDVMIEPQRSKLIPCFKQVKKAALDSGALGCSISGSGPSIFALSRTLDIAQKAADAMQAAFSSTDISNDVYISEINNKGPMVIEDEQ